MLDQVEIAVPGDLARQHQLLALREAVPAGVNARVGRAKQQDARIAKTAADMIVPFDRLGELLAIYDEEFRVRGLDAAVWGHISDGNLHPNVIPRSMADMESGKEAIMTFGREVLRLGGSPLAEHGVGRNPIKQQLLVDSLRPRGRRADARGQANPGPRTSSLRPEYSSKRERCSVLASRCARCSSFAAAGVARAQSGSAAGSGDTKDASPWMLMSDGLLFATVNHQGGPRGGDEFVSTNWWMGMATRSRRARAS